MSKRMGANERQKMQQRKANASRITGKATIGIGKIAVIFVLLAVLAYGGKIGYSKLRVYLKSVEIFKVDKIVLKGVSGEDSLSVLRALGIDSTFESMSVNNKKIKKKILNENYYESINLNRKLPSTLEIVLTKRKPVAFVNLGEIKLMDEKGNLWPMKSRCYWSIPLFSGLKDTVINDRNILTSESMDKVKSFLIGLKETEERRLDGLSQIEFCKNGTILVHLESSSIVAKINNNEIRGDLHRLWQVLGNIKERKEKIPSEVDLSCGKLAFVK